MLRLRRLAALFALLALGGCAEYWAKPGGTPAMFERARLECEQQAFAMLPQVFAPVQVGGGYFTGQETRCTRNGQNQNCYTTPGYYVPPAYSMADQNAGARGSMTRSCLIANGWTPTDDEKAAIAITNSPPPAPPVPEPPAAPARKKRQVAPAQGATP